MASAAQATNSAAVLRRSQLAARRQSKSKTRPKKRGQVLEFPGGRKLDSGLQANRARSAASANINEAQLYATAANNNELFEKERKNKIKWLADRLTQRDRMQAFIAPPIELPKSLQGTTQGREFQEQAGAAQEQIKELRMQDRQLRSQNAQRMQIRRKIQQQKEQIEKIKKAIEHAKLAANEAKRSITATYEIGGIVESEGAALESWFGSGVIFDMLEMIKGAIFRGKDFFKGFLSFLEPPGFSPKSIIAWFQAGYAFFGFLFAIIIFILINLFLAIVGVIVMNLYNYGPSIELLGPLTGLSF